MQLGLGGLQRWAGPSARRDNVPRVRIDTSEKPASRVLGILNDRIHGIHPLLYSRTFFPKYPTSIVTVNREDLRRELRPIVCEVVKKNDD